MALILDDLDLGTVEGDGTGDEARDGGLKINANNALIETAVDLNTAKGGGDVDKVGTPVNNELAVWTGDGTLEGEDKLTFDGTDLTLDGGFKPFTDGNKLLGGFSKRWFQCYADALIATNSVRVDATTVVGSLPSATITALIHTVSDASNTVVGEVVTGGGANFAYVYSDGTNWRILGGTESSGGGDLLADGTVPLTANWDVGAFDVLNLGGLSVGPNTRASSETMLITQNTAANTDPTLTIKSVSDVLALAKLNLENVFAGIGPVEFYQTSAGDCFLTNNDTNGDLQISQLGANKIQLVVNTVEKLRVDGDGIRIGDGGGGGAALLKEQAAAGADVASFGQVWVKDTTPNELWFTDDAGTDVQLGAGGGDALVANPLSQFAATTSLQLLGVMSDETGTGALCFATSPTLVTPALGTPSALVGTNITGTGASFTAGNATLAATVTTNANLTGPVTSVGNATAIADKALAIAKLADGTDGELITWDATGVIDTIAVGTATHVLTSNGVGVAPTFQAAGDALVANPLSQFAATTSLQLKGVLSDETGSGALVFATSPTLVTPDLGTPSALVGTNITGFQESRSLVVEMPNATEDLGFTFFNSASTITEIRAVLVGSDTPSVTWTIRHGTDRSAAGAEVVTGGTTTTSTTTGDDITSFNDATIVADSHLWFETTAQSGTVFSIVVTIFYDKD